MPRFAGRGPRHPGDDTSAWCVHHDRKKSRAGAADQTRSALPPGGRHLRGALRPRRSRPARRGEPHQDGVAVTGTKPPSTVRGVIPVRVMLVDDQQMLIEALAAKLSAEPDIVVVGHCTMRDPDPGGLAALLRPDVITIEVAQAGEAGALLTMFRTAWPAARFVVLTASRDPDQAVDAARAGAAGWASKESSIDVLTHALRCASQGHACFPPEQL